MKLEAMLNGEPRRLELELVDGTPQRLTVDGETYDLDLRSLGCGAYSVLIGMRSLEVQVTRGLDGACSAHVDGLRLEAVVRDPRKLGGPGAVAGATGRQEIRAPMHGKTVRVLVAQGESVEAGAGILVVEAMKMQNEIKAARPGQVREVRVGPGDSVAAGQVLAVLE